MHGFRCRLLLSLLTVSLAALGCVPPTGMAHIVPSPSELRGSVGGGTGTNGPVGSAAVAWSVRARGADARKGLTTAVAWTASQPDPIPDARRNAQTVHGLSPYFAFHLPAGPVDITVPLFLAAGRTGPGLYANIAVYGMAGLMLSHERGPLTLFGGALSTIVGVNDRLQLSVGSRLVSRNGLGLTTEVIYMDEGQPYQSATTSSFAFRRHRSVLFQVGGSFGRPLRKRHEE